MKGHKLIMTEDVVHQVDKFEKTYFTFIFYLCIFMLYIYEQGSGLLTLKIIKISA
jgi:hypothetical protein